MSTKKILILGLALTLMSPLVSYAKIGGESGGGGDAVVIDGEVVLRDMVIPNRITKIKNNVEFINSVPHFRTMISKIAKAIPYFATRIITELNHISLYSSPDKLPVLPYSDTTIAGEAADIQLATRVNDEVILAPEFFGHPQAEYILLHEALHGLLKSNAGPIHHQRVRTIVKHIHDNLNNLDANLLNEILEENNFRDDTVLEEGIYSFMWDESESTLLKCYVYNLSSIYNRAAIIDIGESVFKYLNIKCLPYNGLGQDPNHENFVNDRFPEIISLQKKDNINVTGSISTPYISVFKLEKDSIFKKRLKENQIEQCKKNDSYIKDVNNYLNRVNKISGFITIVQNVLNDVNVKDYEKLALVNRVLLYRYFLDHKVEVMNEFFVYRQNLIETEKGKTFSDLNILNQQNIACKKQYPNL